MRVVIVDDEELARERLETLVAAEEDLEVVASCANGEEALRAIERERPDVVLLDVQMPRLSGFELLQSLELEPMPRVVFTTAFAEHAARAFDVRAVDYLLKPFHRRRFREAVNRLREAVATPSRHELLAAARPRQFASRLVLRTGSRLLFVRTGEIDWIESSGNYVRVYAQAQGPLPLHRQALAEVEEMLDPRHFCRVSRSVVLNLNRVREVVPATHGDLLATLTSGATVRITRNRRDAFERAMTGIQ
jgi:two-component system, LytTR family, response regulator